MSIPGILWGSVGVLGAVQLLRPRMAARGPRWLWVVGWLSLAMLAAFVAFEEFAELKASAAVHVAMRWLNLGVHLGWLVLFVSFATPLVGSCGMGPLHLAPPSSAVGPADCPRGDLCGERGASRRI